MSLKTQITEDMKTAMRAKDSVRLGTIRLLQAAMKQKEVDERVELDDVAIVAQGRLCHHGAARDAATHRALEQVFDQRITICGVDGQWLALPRLHAQGT